MQNGVNSCTEKISVIVPCYNIAGYLARCLESVVNQTYENFECIVIDDGSTDETFEVIRTYQQRDERFIVERQANSGVSAARNRGIALAGGEYIYFLDGDDWIEPDMFMRAAKWLKQGFGLVAFGYEEQSATGETIRLFAGEGPALSLSSAAFLSSLFRKKVRQHLCSFMLDRAVLTRDGLHFSETMQYGEDQEFQIKAIVYSEEVLYDPSCMYHYCHREESAVNRSASLRKLDSLSMYPELRRFLMSESVPKDLLKRYDNFVSMQFLGLLKDGYRTRAARNYFEALKLHEHCLKNATFGWSKFEMMNTVLGWLYHHFPWGLEKLLQSVKKVKVA